VELVIGPIFDVLKELKVIVLGDHADIAKLQAANRSLRTANETITHRLDALEIKQRAHGW
jgi:hypothetical protein